MVTVPDSPAELGQPFTSWRPNQREALCRVLESRETSLLLEAPTAFGKTTIAAGTPALHRMRGVILTQTLALQTQYAQTFPWIASIKGRDNYSSDEEYVDQRNRGMASQVTVTNYQWFLHSATRWMEPNSIGWLICDEAHLIEDPIQIGV